VIILQEHNHNYRIIPIDKNWKKGDKIQHPPANVQLWMGDSRGHWEGNTLVIDVTNFTDKTWVMGEIGGEGISTTRPRSRIRTSSRGRGRCGSASGSERPRDTRTTSTRATRATAGTS
jgi:hypothetical protein